MPPITSPIHFLSISGTSIIGRDTDKLFVYTFLSKQKNGFFVGWYIYLFIFVNEFWEPKPERILSTKITKSCFVFT
jgi:hypothetical protein